MKTRLGPFYTRNGKPLKAGDLIVREDLAATLDRIAEKGADEFYRGSLAEDIQEAVSWKAVFVIRQYNFTYGQTSIARTLMAHTPRLIRTCF